MVRVIGRVDLADEVHRALTAAGIESYVVTAGPTAAAAATGKDGSEADVLVHDEPDVETCGHIKRTVRGRPVVMITPAKHERQVLANMRYASGPDAHVAWPASSDDLRAALARAVTVAETARPLHPRRQLVTLALASAFLLGGLVLDVWELRPVADVASTIGYGLLGAHWWMHATFTSARPLYRFLAGLFLLGAALNVIRFAIR